MNAEHSTISCIKEKKSLKISNAHPVVRFTIQSYFRSLTLIHIVHHLQHIAIQMYVGWINQAAGMRAD